MNEANSSVQVYDPNRDYEELRRREDAMAVLKQRLEHWPTHGIERLVEVLAHWASSPVTTITGTPLYTLITPPDFDGGPLLTWPNLSSIARLGSYEVRTLRGGHSIKEGVACL